MTSAGIVLIWKKTVWTDVGKAAVGTAIYVDGTHDG
jgi:hypothetical protein